jgi:hypothetical protein
MTLVFQRTCQDIYFTLCHAECKLATRDAMSHQSIPGTDYFSNVGAEVTL